MLKDLKVLPFCLGSPREPDPLPNHEGRIGSGNHATMFHSGM